MELADVQRQFHFYSNVKIRFAETDANGHMSHVSPVIYLEQSRTEFLEGLGLFDQKKIQSEGKTFVLAKQTIEYHKQAYFNDQLRVYCKASRIGRSSMELDYVLVNQTRQEIACSGSSIVVYFDQNAQKSTPLPDDIQDRIAHLEAGQSTICKN